MNTELRRKEITDALKSKEFEQMYQQAREDADIYYQAIIESVKEFHKSTPRINECLESKELINLGEKMIKSIVTDVVESIAEKSDKNIEEIMRETITESTVSKAIEAFGKMIVECWNDFLDKTMKEIICDVGKRVIMD